MGVIAAVKRLFGAGAETASAPPPAALREAAGATIDRDEAEWRRLTGDARRDLAPLTQKRMQDLAVYLWKANLLANRMVELPVAYLLAEGVSLSAPDPEAQGWLDAFWRDPINRLDLKLPKKVRELALYGEQCWPVFVNEFDGMVRLGYVDPGLIETVVTDPDNIEQPIGIVTVRDKRGKARRYRVIVNGPETVFSRRTQEIRASFGDGECFYYAINDLSNATRGQSDLMPAMDWLDAYDEALFGELERWNYLRAFIWDVTLKGATQEEVNRRAASIVVPEAGGIRVHNDSEEWDAVSPEIKSYDAGAAARLFRNHVLGGGSIPEHWYGGGGDVNRATAGEMGEPTFKMFSMRQALWKAILEEIGTYVVRQRAKALYGREPDPANQADTEAYAVTANFPELTARDTTKYAAALGQVVAAGAQAITEGLLSKKTVTAIVASIAGRLGVEIDVDAELETALDEAAAKAERDGFPDFPEDDGEPA